MELAINTNSIESYRQFLAVRRCPAYEIRGSTAIVPDQYADSIFGRHQQRQHCEYSPLKFLFDYQRDITRLAIQKKRFAAFIECGLGKTLVMLEFARHAHRATGRPVLIVSPLMVISQTMAECEKFYGEQLQQVRTADLDQWLVSGTGIAITNYESFNEPRNGSRLGGLLADESSLFKDHYGTWGTGIIACGDGVEFKLALTGTPAPNDRIEYANHAVFCGAAKTVNEFLARYFVNRGQTDNRWEMKPHAVGPFYRDLSHWCIFLSDPSVYGWSDNADKIPPINVHIHRVDMTNEQRKAVRDLTGRLFVADVGGIGERSRLGQIAKGNAKGKKVDTLKPQFIRDLVTTWPEESTLIWCLYNEEQKHIAEQFPDAANIDGTTPYEERAELIRQFKSGERRILVSKPKILGFGLNLQMATRQVFSGLQDSYESFWQAVKRSNRVGSTRPLNVHIPITDIEEPMVQNVLRKAANVQKDTEEQQRIFRQYGRIDLEHN